jgi:DUF971 family protein
VDDRTRARDVTIEREVGVTVVFADGHECRFDLEELRVNCPCAACRGDRDRGAVPWPTPSSPTPLAVRDAQFVGAWGLGIEWNDGHATGIYPWDALRRWCDAGGPSFTPDSGRGA